MPPLIEEIRRADRCCPTPFEMRMPLLIVHGLPASMWAVPTGQNRHCGELLRLECFFLAAARKLHFVPHRLETYERRRPCLPQECGDGLSCLPGWFSF